MGVGAGRIFMSGGELGGQRSDEAFGGRDRAIIAREMVKNTGRQWPVWPTPRRVLRKPAMKSNRGDDIAFLGGCPWSLLFTDMTCMI
jgi:hypothetical protein